MISLEPFLQRVRSHIRGFLLPGLNTFVVISAYDHVIVMTRGQKGHRHSQMILIQCFAAKINIKALAAGRWPPTVTSATKVEERW